MSLSDKITKDNIQKSYGKLVIEYVPVEEIFPNEYNPNTHNPDSFDLLLKSLTYFGFTQPIVVHRPTMKIVDGEHRYRAACVLGHKEVPVCYVYFDDIKLRYATLIHNRARGTENSELLQKIYSELTEKDSDWKTILLIDRQDG